ncbi:MAG: hypothetical protein LC135_03065 [Phycisphaerae bacterium]|jgi:hypothetical protein|nr:hypothetical protein [Phycisphaerae bacterium]MCZ2398835.1 hypothetical protein [Phycisphaerae bacterium]
MTSIFEITDWSHVASFFIWTLAVCAIAKGLFGSLPAAELQYRLSLRDAPRRQRMNRLNWEINNRTKWDEDVVRRSPHAAKQPLTEAEVNARRSELQQLARSSLAWRAFTYFMGCFACQTFWTAVAVFALTRGVSGLPDCCFSSAGYSGAAILLSYVYGIRPAGAYSTEKRVRCENCGA